MGTVFSTQFGNNRIDGELMDKSNWAAYVYTQLQKASPVSGSGIPVIGDTTCADGSFTGENCTAKISATNTCQSVYDDITNATVYICGLDVATSTNGTRVCQPGDSGGPVYRYTGQGVAVNADGIISACTNELNPGGKTVYFTDIVRMLSIFGSAVAKIG
jgi:hypothetical protein